MEAKQIQNLSQPARSEPASQTPARSEPGPARPAKPSQTSKSDEKVEKVLISAVWHGYPSKPFKSKGFSLKQLFWGQTGKSGCKPVLSTNLAWSFAKKVKKSAFFVHNYSFWVPFEIGFGHLLLLVPKRSKKGHGQPRGSGTKPFLSREPVLFFLPLFFAGLQMSAPKMTVSWGVVHRKPKIGPPLGRSFAK